MPRQPEQGMSRGSAKRTEARGGRVAVDGRGETRDERGMRRKSKRGWGGWGGGAERGRWWVGWLRRVGGGSLADYVAGWPGERNAGEDAATPCAEEARLLDRGEYIRNVLPPTLYPVTYLRPLLFSLSLYPLSLSPPLFLSSFINLLSLRLTLLTRYPTLLVSSMLVFVRYRYIPFSPMPAASRVAGP